MWSVRELCERDCGESDLSASSKRPTASAAWGLTFVRFLLPLSAVRFLSLSLFQFCSGGWDTNVNVWDITDAETKQSEAAASESQAKKRKKTETAAAAATPVYTPLRTMSGHIGAVTSLVYPHPSSLYSGSMDHNLKQWDVETGACTSTWFGRQVVTAIDFSLNANVLGTGHHDKMIRIWDPRQAEKEVMKMQLRSHKGWVSGVKFHPNQPHQLASSSYDNTVKIWDMRSTLPLFTMQAHTDKALTLDWMDESEHTATRRMATQAQQQQQQRHQNACLTCSHFSVSSLCLSFSSSGRLWSGGADNKLQTHTVKA